MKNIRNAAKVGTLVGVAYMMTLGMMSAQAQDVTIAGSPCTLEIASAPSEDAQVRSEEVAAFRIFGRAGDDYMLIRTGDEDEYVSQTQLQSLFPQLECARFPKVEDTAAVEPGASGDEVTALQQGLASLGYLDGGIDGAYGNGTAEAVRRFQQAQGLEATGSADLYTMLLLTAAANGLEESVEISSEAFASADDKFAQIAENTYADLELFMDPSWRFEFDDFEETGAIDPTLFLGSFAVASPEVDQIAGGVSVKVEVKKDDQTERFVLTPVLAVETEGAYRPEVTSAALSGENTVRIEGGTCTGEIEGVLLRESGEIPLTEEALAALGSGEVQRIRLLGNNTTFDINVSYDTEKMAAFTDACSSLLE